MKLNNEDLTPETKARIDAYQVILDRMKVKDISFCWAPGSHLKSKEERAIAICDALNEIFGKPSDSVRTET